MAWARRKCCRYRSGLAGKRKTRQVLRQEELLEEQAGAASGPQEPAGRGAGAAGPPAGPSRVPRGLQEAVLSRAELTHVSIATRHLLLPLTSCRDPQQKLHKPLPARDLGASNPGLCACGSEGQEEGEGRMMGRGQIAQEGALTVPAPWVTTCQSCPPTRMAPAGVWPAGM